MIIWICTDMEGIAGIDRWEQCYDPDNDSPAYLYGREQLTADVNAAVAGCFDAGATQVRVLDGHGRNRNRGFLEDRLDPRVSRVFVESYHPTRWEGLDAEVAGLAMIGQHAMAGTLNGFIDHTQQPKEICRYLINGQEAGEMSQMAAYAGFYGVPLLYVSGDEALCEEARRLFPQALSTPTKRGTGWLTCDLYPTERVREEIRRDIAAAIRRVDRPLAWRLEPPIEITVEWAWSEPADRMAAIPGVRRLHARTVSWTIDDPRDVFTWPSSHWSPLKGDNP
jgi:D-amino peptidase